LNWKPKINKIVAAREREKFVMGRKNNKYPGKYGEQGDDLGPGDVRRMMINKNQKQVDNDSSKIEEYRKCTLTFIKEGPNTSLHSSHKKSFCGGMGNNHGEIAPDGIVIYPNEWKAWGEPLNVDHIEHHGVGYRFPQKPERWLGLIWP
jgi:hypothetical protein